MTARASRPLSETRAWQMVQQEAENARYALSIKYLGGADTALDKLIRLAGNMLEQLQRSVHANPPLIVWGNPPDSAESHLMSKRVYAIEYRHVDDDEDYRHPFAAGVSMFAHGKHGQQVTLYRPDGKPLSRDF